MEGYSGAEITAVCREAALISLKQDLSNRMVTMDHLIQAMDEISPRTPLHLMSIYEQFSR